MPSSHSSSPWIHASPQRNPSDDEEDEDDAGADDTPLLAALEAGRSLETDDVPPADDRDEGAADEGPADDRAEDAYREDGRADGAATAEDFDETAGTDEMADDFNDATIEADEIDETDGTAELLKPELAEDANELPVDAALDAAQATMLHVQPPTQSFPSSPHVGCVQIVPHETSAPVPESHSSPVARVTMPSPHFTLVHRAVHVGPVPFFHTSSHSSPASMTPFPQSDDVCPRRWTPPAAATAAKSPSNTSAERLVSFGHGSKSRTDRILRHDAASAQ